jgi:hypothetical protein
MQTKLLAVDIKSLIKKIPFSHIVGCEGIYSHLSLWMDWTIYGLTQYIIFITVFVVCLMVFNTTFNNISVISWRSVLLVEEIREPEENHRPVASHWRTVSHNVVYLALMEIWTHNISGEIPYDRGHDSPHLFFITNISIHWFEFWKITKYIFPEWI